VIEHGSVPLLWDVDGASARRKGMQPVFSAPALNSTLAYANDRQWFPATRHGSGTQVAFVGGHVASSKKPLAEDGWMWGYQPAR
jgi:prepilin-type processing-associated H-X9-DG protein